VLDIVGGDTELLYYPSEIQNTNIIQVCRINFLHVNKTIFATFLVESESAIRPAYDNCSFNADHRNMTKFTGRADAGYGQVRGVLER